MLSAARLRGGASVAATTHALLLPGPPGSGAAGVAGWHRLPWHLVAAATWDDERSVLTVEEVGTGGAGPRQHRLTLDEPSLLPEAVRERVTSSIVVSSHVPLVGRAGVRVVARRRFPGGAEDAGHDEGPAGNGLEWQLLFDPEVDPADPDVRERAEQALAEVRRQTA